jgi:hypothetical protein
VHPQLDFVHLPWADNPKVLGCGICTPIFWMSPVAGDVQKSRADHEMAFWGAIMPSTKWTKSSKGEVVIIPKALFERLTHTLAFAA